MKTIPTTAGDLMGGDVFATGFVVTHNAYRGPRTPKGKVVVEGNMPGKATERLILDNGCRIMVRI